MTDPLTEMSVDQLLCEYGIYLNKQSGLPRMLEVRDELKRRINSKPRVAAPRPLADLSIGELLCEYRNEWDACNDGGWRREHDIRCEVERRVKPVPVPPAPIEHMASEELLLERNKRHAEMTDATNRFNRVVMAIYSRRTIQETSA